MVYTRKVGLCGILSIFVTLIFMFLFTQVSFAKTPLSSAKRIGEPSAAYINDEVIIRFKPEVVADSTQFAKLSASLHKEIGARVLKESRTVRGLQLVKLPPGTKVTDAVVKYKRNASVLYAEPNYIIRCSAIMPNDPNFSSLWGLHNTGQLVNGVAGTVDADIDAPEAWNYTTGTGTIIIAVIDSGVAYDHPDLSGNIWVNSGEVAGNGRDDDGNGYIDDVRGWDFVDEDNDPYDFNMHGTHVAGTIAAVGNNAQGVTGVNWRAKIMPLRFMDAMGFGDTYDAIEAINYAARNGAHIINCSWGGSSYSQALKDAIDGFPGLVVCAAGNEGSNNDSFPDYPASYTCPNIISVASTDQNDGLAYFSNYGASSVDVAAPGVNIYSTVPGRKQIFFDGMTNLGNWTVDYPWGLSTVIFYSSPSSATDSPSGNYAANSNVTLTLKNPVDLSSERGAKLEYKLRLDTEQGYDGLFVEASTDQVNWTTISGYTGYSSYFMPMEEDLSAYDGKPAVYIRFRLFSDEIINYDGAYIDDVRITTISGWSYEYADGTSMAAPHVAGLAGLVKAIQPGYGYSQLRDAVLRGVDVKSSLSGKVATGGRINAAKALSSVATLPPKGTIDKPAQGATVSGTVTVSG
ncbi:MAG: S8 family serine peptidase, partial [Bacillota bacterium]|nr:S8 family serine peptidase [Bacillota bacterium]